MKNKKLVGSIILMVFVMLFLSSIGNSRNLNNSPEMAQEEPSKYININHSIYIDGNFSETVAMYPWATGKGTIFDKFTIQGINITGGQLVIQNVEYFTVQDCIISEYEKPYGHHIFAGISIGNSSFGIIERNTIISCSQGISLYDDAEDILILNNIFTGSHDDPNTGLGSAVLIHDAISVEISENAIINYYNGIIVRNAGKIYIINNRIETSFGYISDTGIYFDTVNDSSIITNDFFGCNFTGHDFNVTTSNNDGLEMSLIENCNNLTIYGNRFYDLDGNLIVPDVVMKSMKLNYLIFISGIVIVAIVVVIVVLIKKRNK